MLKQALLAVVLTACSNSSPNMAASFMHMAAPDAQCVEYPQQFLMDSVLCNLGATIVYVKTGPLIPPTWTVVYSAPKPEPK